MINVSHYGFFTGTKTTDSIRSKCLRYTKLHFLFAVDTIDSANSTNAVSKCADLYYTFTYSFGDEKVHNFECVVESRLWDILHYHIIELHL